MRTLISILCFLPLALWAQSSISTESYAVNFDRNTTRTHASRYMNSISLAGTTIAIEDRTRMYYDLTPQQFVVQPGQTVTPSFGFNGAWMHGYVYIDLDRNGQFDVQTPGPRGALTEGNELVSFSALSLEDGAFNSNGEELSSLNVLQPPTFTIPEDMETGLYMMRWKIDWDNCDPAGRVDETNSIITNGGAIIDVLLLVTTEPVADTYQLVFADEFNQPDGSIPDPTVWRVSTRRKSTWNRWISNSPDVAFIEGGHLVCRAIPNPDTSTDDVPMITGSVETQGLFSFTYGKVEIRLRTNPYKGNFPAAWMMPQPPCQTWPNSGEIDIFEAIDAQNTSYHTIHSHWSYDLGHKSDPQSSFSKSVTVGEWHVYGLEWTEDKLIFTVDGVVTGTYPRSTNENALTNGQWPFEHPFYLILNQSVGDGSWAKAADTSHIYETRFDYVRVYQRATEDAIPNVPATDFSAGSSRLYDLSGRPVNTSHPRPGIYLRNGKKVLVEH